MKNFKIIGPLTTREFDINNDEMLTWAVIKVKDFQENPKRFETETLKVYNEKIYKNEDQLF